MTALPVPVPRSLQAPAPAIAMLLAPMTALIPGVVAWLSAALCGIAGLNSLVAAAVALGALALTTRGLHLDGLADSADGFAASYQREQALQVMRRGDTGPAGLATVTIVLLIQAAALAQVLELAGWRQHGHWLDHLHSAAPLLIAVAAARVAVPMACVRGVPAARIDGLGATVAGSAGVVAVIVCAVTTATAAAFLAGWSNRPWRCGPVAVLAVIIAAVIVIRRSTTRFGGITGDVIGACVEIGTTAALLALAAAG